MPSSGPPPTDPPSPEDATRREPETSASKSTGSPDSEPDTPSSTSGGERTTQEPPSATAHSAFGPGNEPTDPSQPQGLASRYRLIRVLGKGGFANVYLAYDSVLDQEVAIKILKLGQTSASDRDRFLREARISAKLRHPNIATVFDIIQTADGLQMVMEYYSEGTLSDIIKLKGPPHLRETISIARQVALALAYAHRRNIVHRDVKPANIFLADEEMIKLGDFGIAAHTELHEFTQTGMVIGTPLYMAPEQASDSRDVDPRADLYALGLTLYHMLTGRPPRVVDLDKVPPLFRKLIRVATEPDRNERLVSAEQFVAMLDQVAVKLKGARGAQTQDSEFRGEEEELPTPTTITPVLSESSTPPTPDSAPEPEISASVASLQTPSQPPLPEQASEITPSVGPSTTGKLPRGVWYAAAGILIFATAIAIVISMGTGSRQTPKTLDKVASIAPSVTPTAAPTQPPTLSPTASAPSPTVPPPATATPKPVVTIATSTPSPAPPRSTVTPRPTPMPPEEVIRAAMVSLRREHPVVDRILKAIENLTPADAKSGSRDMAPLMREQLLDQQLVYLEEEITRTPNNAILCLMAARTYERVKKAKEAQKYYAQAIALDAKTSRPLRITKEVIKRLRQNRVTKKTKP